jgi:RNase P/RNase MRP subunit p30
MPSKITPTRRLEESRKILSSLEKLGFEGEVIGYTVNKAELEKQKKREGLREFVRNC